MKNISKVLMVFAVAGAVFLSCSTIYAYTFTQTLRYGMTNNTEVAELQKFLIASGYLQGEPNGMIYQTTQDAIKKFQAAYGLAADGVVGAKTRAALNLLQGASPNANAGIPSSLQVLIDTKFPKFCEANHCARRSTGYTKISDSQYYVWAINGAFDDSTDNIMKSALVDCSGTSCEISFTFPQTWNCQVNRGHTNFSQASCN